MATSPNECKYFIQRMKFLLIMATSPNECRKGMFESGYKSNNFNKAR